MKHKFHLQLILLLFTVLFSISIIAQGDNLALTTTVLNGRSGPAVTFGVVTQFPHASTVAVLARNDVGNWLYIREVNSGVEAWVSATYLSLPDSLNVMSLPIQQAQQTESSDQPQTPQGQVAISGSGTGVTISALRVRIGPSTDKEAINNIPAKVQVAIESRNRFGDWIIVRTIDGTIRGWVASRYVNFGDGVALEALPISTEIIGALPEEQIISDLQITLPEGETSELVGRLVNTPIFYNFNTARVHAIFRLGQENGNRPNVFMKVGDSVTATQPFMLAYGQGGGYDLGPYAYLQDTINHFAGVSPREGVANSFTNRSFAALSGGTSASMLDGLWADPIYCTNQSPLMCEINYTRPSVGFVLFGTQDMRILQPYEFRIYMAQITEAMMYNGVIPVLSTFHNNPTYYGEQAIIFNNIILDIADEYDVPLINLWKATQPLPDNGVWTQDPVHLTQGVDNYYNFTGEENLYGVNMRNLLVLQALDDLRKNILTQ